GRFLKSVDGATTFTTTSPLPPGSVVMKLVVFVTNPGDPTGDILFAAVNGQFAFGSASGIWRSTNGGSNWTLITDLTGSPFFSQPNFVPFSDVEVDPTNPNVIYAAIGSQIGDA